MPPYLGESQETAQQFLSMVNLQPFNAPRNREDISVIVQYLDTLAPGNTAAKASVDIALHDLLGKLNGAPCYRFFGVNPSEMPATSFPIGLYPPASIRKKVREQHTFRVIKVKT